MEFTTSRVNGTTHYPTNYQLLTTNYLLITTMELKAEDRLILSCVKIQPGATELEQINNLIPLIQDWETLTKNIIDRGIGPLLYKKLPLDEEAL